MRFRAEATLELDGKTTCESYEFTATDMDAAGEIVHNRMTSEGGDKVFFASLHVMPDAVHIYPVN